MFILNQDNSITYINKIHGRHVMHTTPEEFGSPVITVKNNRSFFMVSHLKGESRANWTQLISVASTKGVNIDELTMENIVQHQMGFYTEYCAPEKISSTQDFPAIKFIDNHESMLGVLACGDLIKKEDLKGSFETLYVNIKVPDGYYSIAWTERGPSVDMPLVIDKEKWIKRLRQLEPLEVLNHFPPKGTASPAPSKNTSLQPLGHP